MQQTLLALAAILAFAYLSLGRQRHDNDVERRSMEIEAELAATDLASAQMSRLERLAFDEGDTGRQGIRTATSTLTLGPDDEETGPATWDDVDDWNEHSWTEAVPVGRDSLRFALRVDVQYVDDFSPEQPASTSTFTKEIVVSVVEIAPQVTDRTQARATLRRVVTPASVVTYIHPAS